MTALLMTFLLHPDRGDDDDGTVTGLWLGRTQQMRLGAGQRKCILSQQRDASQMIWPEVHYIHVQYKN